MPKFIDPKQVRYLAFEGGGGKGLTYLGAIEALESRDCGQILPVRPGGQIRGISGASAGAITALLLACGASSTQISAVIAGHDFTKFFDGPSPALSRGVDKDNNVVTHRDPDIIVAARWRTLDALYADQLLLLLNFAKSRIATTLGLPILSIVAPLLNEPKDYLYNLLFDRGLFPGWQVRRFFSELLTSYLEQKLLKGRRPNGGALNFYDFYNFTNVDLVVTGTNIATRRSLYFSKDATPSFPVAEAVGISMSLPFLFKPVRVEVQGAKSDRDPYAGRFVDGGLLNNLPIHAFDKKISNGKGARPPASEKGIPIYLHSTRKCSRFGSFQASTPSCIRADLCLPR